MCYMPLRRATAIFLPGLAADSRLFQPQLEGIRGFAVPDWLTPEQDESLSHYAARYAAMFNLPRHPYLIGGFSFGGIVAMELVRHLHPKPAGLVLICGVRSRRQFTMKFRAQALASRVVPGGVQRLLYGAYAKRFARSERLSPSHTELLIKMAVSNDPAFVKWSTSVCAAWDGKSEQWVRDFHIPVYHIHGEKDRVIPDVDRCATKVIAGAGHLITLTHAAEVNAELLRLIDGMPKGSIDIDAQVAQGTPIGVTLSPGVRP